ncbi:MAG: heme exporter protein CcmB [Gemmatimonadota bacterium]
MTYLRQVGVILWKDVVLELRTRERIGAMAAFAVLVGILLSYATDPTVVRPDDVAAGFVWMTIVFGGLLGVGRTFQLEAEDGAFNGVLMSPTPRDAIFLGKVAGNFVLVLAVSLLILAVFGLFFSLDYGSSPGVLVLVVALGVLGFVALGTLFAAVSWGTSMGETLLPVLLFPLLVPMVIYGVSATGRLLAGRPVAEVAGNIRMLAAFALLAVAAGAGLFRFVVEE